MLRYMRHLPNILTFFRIVLIPIFVVLMIDPSPLMVNAAVWVFVVASITDYVDGLIARTFSAVSDFGKLLDPLADKILVMAGLVMLVSQPRDPNGEAWVYSWMVVLALAREIWVTGLRGVAASRGIIVAAKGAGKLKSGFQMVAIVMLLLHSRPVSSVSLFSISIPIDVPCQFVGLNLLLVSLFFSIWGAVEYTWEILGESKEHT